MDGRGIEGYHSYYTLRKPYGLMCGINIIQHTTYQLRGCNPKLSICISKVFEERSRSILEVKILHTVNQAYLICFGLLPLLRLYRK